MVQQDASRNSTSSQRNVLAEFMRKEKQMICLKNTNLYFKVFLNLLKEEENKNLHILIPNTACVFKFNIFS